MRRAQTLTLEELRLLSNLETAKEKILQLVIAGQPELDDLLSKLVNGDRLTHAVLSKPRSRELPRRVTVDPIELRGETAFRFTTHLGDRTTHENLPPEAARERLGTLLVDYRQGLLQDAETDWQVLGQTILRRDLLTDTSGGRPRISGAFGYWRETGRFAAHASPTTAIIRPSPSPGERRPPPPRHRSGRG